MKKEKKKIEDWFCLGYPHSTLEDKQYKFWQLTQLAGKIFSRGHFEIFFSEIGLEIHANNETIYMKCQFLFSEEKIAIRDGKSPDQITICKFSVFQSISCIY